MKAESLSSNRQVLRMEALVLKRLQGIPQVCEFIGCGRTEKANFLVMTLLGPNLSELRKKQVDQKFSISTVLRLGVQIIKVVQSMHNCGFLHRDLKPSNFAMGVGENAKTCFLLDFGLSRQYIMPTGELKPPRGTTGFRGTIRYASLNAHKGCDLGRQDDLWSVFYMLVELANGSLPWKALREKEDVGKAKLHYNHHKLITALPHEFNTYLEYLQQLTYYDKPNYAYLIDLFEQAQKNLGISECDLLDWEQPAVTKLKTTELIKNDEDFTVSEKKDVTCKVANLTPRAVDNHQVTSDQEDRPLLCDMMSSSTTNSKKEIIEPLVEHHILDLEEKIIENDKDEKLPYAIPLPLEPKPDGYIFTRARKYYVKCSKARTLFHDYQS